MTNGRKQKVAGDARAEQQLEHARPPAMSTQKSWSKIGRLRRHTQRRVDTHIPKYWSPLTPHAERRRRPMQQHAETWAKSRARLGRRPESDRYFHMSPCGASPAPDFLTCFSVGAARDLLCSSSFSVWASPETYLSRPAFQRGRRRRPTYVSELFRPISAAPQEIDVLADRGLLSDFRRLWVLPGRRRCNPT